MPNNPTSNTASDKKTIRELIKLIEETSLTEIEYETEAFRVRLARNNFAAPNYIANIPQAMPQQVMQPASQNTNAPIEVKEIDYNNHPNVVKSPMVGVVYLAPEPGAPTYVKEGDTVNTEQTLLLIEAMKTFNPVKATKNGKVVKILIADGTPVEYGEPLLVLE